MAKKEFIKLTPDSLQFATIIHYNNISLFNSFSGKEIFLTDGFEGDTQYLNIILGYMGAFPDSRELDKATAVIIIGNKLLQQYNNGEDVPFFKDLEERLNQNNSPYRKTQIISEDHFIWYLENRNKTTPTQQIMEYLKKYNISKKSEKNLFD